VLQGQVAATGDQFGTATAQIDPALDALKTNSGKMAGSNVGGQSPMAIDTFALLIGSTALNSGDPGTGGTTCEATDQRGVARPGGSACHIGAFEDATGAGRRICFTFFFCPFIPRMLLNFLLQ
jgi:hypothetical protein